ncbi:MAG TPA: hypothetical protein VIG33_14350 [Pseudobdellovibrionaceae bacterium]|jgi:hypothetical protein
MCRFVLLFTVFMTSKISYASELSCNQEITREPYCVSIATAKVYCAKLGSNPETLLKSKKCYVDMTGAGEVITPAGARLTCFLKPVNSSDESLNNSNCGSPASAASSNYPKGAR